jgi:hypothetical protein
VYTQVHRLFICLFVCWFSAAHNRGRAAKFAVTSFAKRELAVNTLRKVKSVKTFLTNTRFVPITKSNEDLV